MFSNYSFAQKTTISGNILNQSGSTVKLANIIAEIEVGTSKIDSKGVFKIEVTLEEADFYRLSVSEEEYVVLILEPGQRVELNWDINNMLEPKIEGSPDSKLVYAKALWLKNPDDCTGIPSCKCVIISIPFSFFANETE